MQGLWQGRRRRVALLAVLAGWAASGCFRLHMYDQPHHEPLEASAVFADGRSARLPVPGTVARGDLVVDRAYATGMATDSTFADAFPFAITREILERGHERYDIFCSACHDRVGNGRGMVVRRGYKQPPSFHIDRLRQQPAGYFFDVITNGFAKMPAYARQIPVEDRWAIVAYLRVLQQSQYTQVEGLPAATRQRVLDGLAGAAEGQHEDEEHH